MRYYVSSPRRHPPPHPSPRSCHRSSACYHIPTFPILSLGAWEVGIVCTRAMGLPNAQAPYAGLVFVPLEYPLLLYYRVVKAPILTLPALSLCAVPGVCRRIGRAASLHSNASHWSLYVTLSALYSLVTQLSCPAEDHGGRGGLTLHCDRGGSPRCRRT